MQQNTFYTSSADRKCRPYSYPDLNDQKELPESLFVDCYG